MSSQQDKRIALVKRITSQSIQLTALNASINKLRKQELNHVQHQIWPYGQTTDKDTETSIHTATELTLTRTHITNAINQLNALAAMLKEGSAYDE
jgi:uncharacterized membrane protein